MLYALSLAEAFASVEVNEWQNPCSHKILCVSIEALRHKMEPPDKRLNRNAAIYTIHKLYFISASDTLG